LTLRRFCSILIHHSKAMKNLLPHSVLIALCLLLPSCEGLDPALLGAMNNGGGGGYQNERYVRPTPRYDDGSYDRGYQGDAYRRPDPYRSDYQYGRQPGRSYNDYSRDSHQHSTYDSHRDESDSHPVHDRNYYGGSNEWEKSGYALGKRDRREGKSNNYRRHQNHYDGKTQSHFADGYQQGYNR
jgi:hypothetical protein